MPKQPRAGRRVQYRRLLQNLYKQGDLNKPQIVSVESVDTRVKVLTVPEINAHYNETKPIEWALRKIVESDVQYPTGILVQDPRLKRYIELNTRPEWVLRKVSGIKLTSRVNLPANDPRRAIYGRRQRS